MAIFAARIVIQAFSLRASALAGVRELWAPPSAREGLLVPPWEQEQPSVQPWALAEL